MAKKNKPAVNSVTVDRRKRIRKMATLVAEGKTQLQMSKILGVSQKTISKDIILLKKAWLKEDTSWGQALYSRRVRQLTSDREKALAGYKRSQTNEVDKKCKTCKGKGFTKESRNSEEVECEICEGEGTITVIKQLNGDPAFLNTSINAVKEMMKVEGLYPSKSIQIEDKSQHIHVTTGDNPFANASDEEILEAKAVLELVKKSGKKLLASSEDSDTIDGEIISRKK